MTSTEIRSLELDQKIDYFRTILKNVDNENPIDILNIYRLINSYNTFDDDFFEDENSYICDISEFIDIKMTLQSEIEEFSLILVTWYLSTLASCDIKADNDVDNLKDLPMLVYGFFTSATIPVMASIMNSVDMSQIDMTKLYRVKNAFVLMSNMFRTQSFVASYLKNL